MSETDEEKLRRHLAEFNAAVAEACDLPDDAPDHIKAMADMISPRQEQQMSNDWLNVDIDSDDDAYPEDDPYETPYGMEFNAGREYEREAIVEWLRQGAQRYADMYGQPVDSLPAHMYAGWIERGEHVKGTDDSSHVSGTCKEGCDDE